MSATSSTRRPLHALVYGDVNLNIIDGSAVWAQAMVQALALAGCRVTLLLKAPVSTERLLQPLRELEGVRLVAPFEENLLPEAKNALSPVQAVTLLEQIDVADGADMVVVRGARVVHRIVSTGAFERRLWPYLTDIPQDVASFTSIHGAELGAMAANSRFVLCQTEELRGFLEAMVPECAGKCLLWTPSVPAGGEVHPRSSPLADDVQLVYTGKFAKRWKTLEMTRLPELLARRGLKAQLHMLGDKIHDEPQDHDFAASMRTALTTSKGVRWHGGMSREASMAKASRAHFGLSWRDETLDASLELSTKVLEFAVTGVPVLLNRTPMHERLLGTDYPLFVIDEEDITDAVAEAVHDPSVYLQAAERCLALRETFSLTAAVERLDTYLSEAFPTPAPPVPRAEPLRVLVVGHDLKFLTGLLEHFESLPHLDVRVDRWSALGVHDARASTELLKWADTVFVEWCGPAAVWYAQRKRASQRLVVRLHRFELYGAWPRQLAIEAVDQVVCVSPHYADLTVSMTGWPREKVVAVPNGVDLLQFERGKLEGARFNLGFIGVAPARKRTDRALDVLEELRSQDQRFRLLIKSKMPWEYWWIWRKEEERHHFRDVLRRIETSPLLRGAVAFDGFGGDVPAWLRKVGHILSTSDDESFHLAPAEGMASGAVPAVLHWPGADTIYDAWWLHEDVESMAAAILANADKDVWPVEAAAAHAQARRDFALPRVRGMLVSLLYDDGVGPYRGTSEGES